MASLGFAVFIMLVSFLWTLFALILSLSSYTIIEKEHNRLEEFFKGLKQGKKYRSHVVTMMVRRLIYVAILITFESVTSKITISVLSGIQVLYFVHVTRLRPNDKVSSNLIEIINEFSFIVLLVLLIPFNTENDWTVVFAYIYIQILVITSLVDFLIIKAYAIKKL